MKQFALLLAAFTMACGFAGCAQKAKAEKNDKVLVAYFSATGTTKKVAEKIASATGGTLFEIVPEKAYTTADLNWRDKTSRSSVEMNDSKSRPAVKGKVSGMENYTTIYLGFPIWWDEAPRIINTFIENNDLDDKAVIPFATSGGSGISNAEQELKKAYPEINWKDGKLLNRASEKDITEWIK